jgi:hypothetical protein
MASCPLRARPAGPRQIRYPRDRGFLLVEALVALAIVSLMAALVFDTVWQMGKTAVVANEKRQALLLAQSVLAAASVPGSVSPIAPRGTDGPLTWQVASEPYTGEASDGLQLQTVSVAISDAATGRVLARLQSLKAQQ